MNDNLRVQVETEQGPRSGFMASTTTHARALQHRVARPNRALQGNRQALELIHARQGAQQSDAPANASRSCGHDTQAIASVVRALLPALQGRSAKERFPEIQTSKSLALFAFSGCCRQWNFGLLFQGRENSRGTHSIQPAPGYKRCHQVLPGATKAERLDFASGMRNEVGAVAEDRQEHWAGFRRQASGDRQQRRQGGESEPSQEIIAPVASGTTADCTPQQRQQSSEESVPSGCADSRTDWKPAARLLAQDGKALRQRLRHYLCRKFERVGDGQKPSPCAGNHRRIMDDAATVHRGQGCKCRAHGDRGASALDIPKVFIVRGNRTEGVERANARLSALWLLGLPRHQCGKEHFKAGMQPSGRGCNSDLVELINIGFIR